MRYLDLAGEAIKKDEGLVLKPYKCSAGKLSIGYGRNLEDRGIDKEEAEFLFNTDIKTVDNQLKILLSEVFNTLSDKRKAILVNMGFNLGVYGLLKFKKMIKALECADFETASLEMLDSRWAKQVGNRAKRLSNEMK